jgi:hypothetical protein
MLVPVPEKSIFKPADCENYSSKFLNIDHSKKCNCQETLMLAWVKHLLKFSEKKTFQGPANSD